MCDLMRKKAVVLLSGGLDSSTTLAIAQKLDYLPYALSFRYGQRHACELEAAKRVAREMAAVEHRLMGLDVDYSNTHSCYDPGESCRPCGRCDSCLLRRNGFREAGLEDPLEYPGLDEH